MKSQRIYLRESRKRHIECIEPAEGRLIQFLMAVATILIALLPTFQEGIYFHGDIAFHMGRIESLYLGLRNCIFPLKVHPSLANSFGYGEGFFYPDTILYFPALLQLAGVSLEGSFKIFSGAMILLAWFFMYVMLRRLLRRRHSFLWGFGASIYILSFRFLHSLYDYGSIGTYTAMVFIPMAIGGLLVVLFQEYQLNDLVWMTVGVCLVLLSHSTSAIMTLVFMLVLFLLSIQTGLQKRKILHLMICAGSTVLATIGYWLPAVEQVCSQKFYLQTNPVLLLTDNILGPADILKFSGVADVCVVIVTVLMWILALQIFQAKAGAERECSAVPQKQDQKMIKAVGLTSILFTVLVFFSPFWKTIGPYIQFVQSPTRLMSSTLVGICFTLCLSCARILDGNAAKKTRTMILALTGLLVLCMVQAIAQIPSYGETVAADSIDYTGTIMGLGAGTEWLPDGGSQYAIEETERAIDPDGGGACGNKEKDGAYFDVYVRMDMAYYDMPYFYYKGYAAYLLDDAGSPIQELEVKKAPAERHGYVRVILPEGGNGIGHILVTYRKTKIQKLAYVINGGFVIVAGIILSKIGSSGINEERRILRTERTI